MIDAQRELCVYASNGKGDKVAKKVVADNAKGYTWSRKQPAPTIDGVKYQLARVENDGETPTHYVLMESPDGSIEVLHRKNGTPVRFDKPAQFEPFLEAMLSR